PISYLHLTRHDMNKHTHTHRYTQFCRGCKFSEKHPIPPYTWSPTHRHTHTHTHTHTRTHTLTHIHTNTHTYTHLGPGSWCARCTQRQRQPGSSEYIGLCCYNNAGQLHASVKSAH